MYITGQNVHTFSIESKFIKYLSSLKEIKLKGKQSCCLDPSSVKCFLLHSFQTCGVCYHDTENIYQTFVVSTAAQYEQDTQ